MRSFNTNLIIKILVDVVLVLEFFNTSATIDKFLLSCKERMACWANVQSNLRHGRFSNKTVTTCASYFTFLIIRMDSFLHVSHLFPAQVPPGTLCIIAYIWNVKLVTFPCSYTILSQNTLLFKRNIQKALTYKCQ